VFLKKKVFLMAEKRKSSSTTSGTNKRQVIQALRLDAFRAQEMVKMGAVEGNFVPFTLEKGGPIFLDFECDGNVPVDPSFGLHKFNDNFYAVKINVGNTKTQALLNKMEDELQTLLSPVIDLHPQKNGRPLECYPLLYVKKEIKPGATMFPPLLSIELAPREMETGVLVIKDISQTPATLCTNIEAVLGARVGLVRCEIQGFTLDFQKYPNKIMVSLRKKLRYMEYDSTAGQSFFKLLTPDVQCEMENDPKLYEKFTSSKMATPILLRDLDVLKDIKLHPMSEEAPAPPKASEKDNKKNDKKLPAYKKPLQQKEEKTQIRPRVANLTRQDGEQPLILRFTGGGFFPPNFAFQESERDKNFSLSWNLNSEVEVKKCEEMTKWLEDRTFENADNWFPEALAQDLDEKAIRRYAKKFIRPPQRKVDSKLSDEEKKQLKKVPLKEGEETWPRSLTCIIDCEKRMSNRIDSAVKVVDSNMTRWTPDQLPDIAGKKWKEIWIQVSRLVRKAGDPPSIAFSRRVVFVQLDHDSSQYDVQPAAPLEEQEQEE
jgi:hypothetical protein